jgi:hypothetical protein
VTGSERNRREFNELKDNLSQPIFKEMANARPRGLGIWYIALKEPQSTYI